MRNRGSKTAGLAEELRGAHDEIVIVDGQRGVVAHKLQPRFLTMRKVERIEDRQWAEQALEVVKTVVPPPQYAQRQIDLGRSEELHEDAAGGRGLASAAVDIPRPETPLALGLSPVHVEPEPLGLSGLSTKRA